MILEDFPNCCTAKILTGLGTAPTAGYHGQIFNTDEAFYDHAKNLIEVAARAGKALIFAITVPAQERAIRGLATANGLTGIGRGRASSPVH